MMDKVAVFLLVLQVTFTHGEPSHQPGSTVRSKRQLPGLPGPEDYGLGYLSSPRMLDVQRRIMGQMENELQLQLMAKFNAQMDKTLNKDDNKLNAKQNTDLPDENMRAPRDNIVQSGNNVVSVPDQPSMSSPSTSNHQTSFLPLQPAYTQFVPYNDQMGSPPVLQSNPMASGIPTSPFGQMIPVDPHTSFRTNGAVPLLELQSSQVPFYAPSAPSGPSLVPRMEHESSGNNRNSRVLDAGTDGKKASKVPKEWQFLMSAFRPREGRSLGSPYIGSFGRESRMQDVPRSKPNAQDEWEAYRMRKRLVLQQSTTTTTTTTTLSPLMDIQAVPGMHARMLDRDSSPQKTSHTKFRYI